MKPAFKFQSGTVVSLPSAVYFHGSDGFKFKAVKYVLQLLTRFTSCLLFQISANAQTDSAAHFGDTAILEPITVTAFGGAAGWKDAPASVAVINQAQLQRFDNKTLVPVLNTVAGVRMEERSPGSYRLSIRGSLLRSPFGVRNIKVYWNDIPLTDAGGNTYLNLIDVSQLSSIEIIKGPASSLYGANTGGAVLLKTNNNNASPGPERRKNSFNANLETGSYSLLNEQLVFNHQSKKFNFSMQQSHYQSSGYRQQSAMRKDAVQSSLDWHISNKEQVSALLFYTDLHYETPGGITKAQMDSLPTLARQPTSALPGAVQQKAGVYNKTGFAGLNFHSVFSKLWSNTASVTINHTDFKNPFITNYEKRDELNYGARTVLEMNALKVKWLTGAEWQQNISNINNYENNSGTPGSLLYNDKVRVAQYFLFTQINIQFRKLLIQAGLSANQQLLKYNRISDSVYNYWQHQNTNMLWAPRLSVLYQVNNNISLYAVTSKGFSPPTLAEVRPSTNQFYNLQPEYGWNYEAGIKGAVWKNRLEFSASVYSFNLKNAIVAQTDSTGADFFVNAGGTKQPGLEIWLNAFPVKNSRRFIKTIVVSNSFAYQPYTFNNYVSGTKDFSGNRLTGVPKNTNLATLDVDTKPGIYFNANCNFTSAIPLTDANDVYAGNYKLFQLKLGFKKQFGKAILDVYAGIDNLLNEKYSLGNDLNAAGGRYFNPAPARNYFAGARVEW
ncbi:TonB-dependent receptor [Parafilimonas sp.]|uniref:TonB-dependent receptor n=1 Tax=Parafilimonas sp. TaxID=1969739 RepID=UPI0039E47D93